MLTKAHLLGKVYDLRHIYQVTLHKNISEIAFLDNGQLIYNRIAKGKAGCTVIKLYTAIIVHLSYM